MREAFKDQEFNHPVIYDFQPDPSEFCINREQVSGGDLSDVLLVILQQIILTVIGIFKKAYMKFLTYV